MPLPKKPIDFAEWRPDLALLDNKFAAVAENVYAGANAYEPFLGLGAVTTEQLPGRCVGLFSARANDGTYQIYAGTPTDIYWWDGATWYSVTRLVGGPYDVHEGDRWSFCQFGTKLIAVHPYDAPQQIDIETEGSFTALAGLPPWARTCATIGDFVVLACLDTNTRMIRWSGINDTTSWTVGTDLCDEQEFPDGGLVQGVAGGEIGYVLQDKSIRSMQFLPGNTDLIFSFSRIEREKGAVGSYCFIYTRGTLFLLAEDGFYGLGAQNPAIGNDAVNHWFLTNSDPNRRDEVVCFADMAHTRAFWAFHQTGSSANYDRLIIFDWNLNKWTYSTEAAQMWTGAITSPGVSLDTEIGGNEADYFLDSEEPSLDSVMYQPGRPVSAAIDINGYLSVLAGNPLAATIETAEQHLSPGQRSFVSAVYPVVDAAPVTVAIGERERLQDTVSFGQPLGVESTGSVPVYSSSRLHRFRMFVPAKTTWTHAQGVIPEVQPDGEGY